MTETFTPRAVGTAPERRDGAQKVRGTAPYADDSPVENPVWCRIVQASVARGRATRVDPAVAETADGVLTVLTPANAERLADTSDAEYAILQDDAVHFRGQVVAAVVAETFEQACYAADLVDVGYDAQRADTRFAADRDDLYPPEQADPADTVQGDVDAAPSAVTLDRTYTTPWEHNNPMEPHATTALWEPTGHGGAGSLTLWDSTQGVHTVRDTVSTVLGLDPGQVRVVCPYVGGGFGSKGVPHQNPVVAAMAARAVPGRPVRLALTRQQMFALAGYRTPTIQRVRLGADRTGRLDAIAVDVVEQTSRIKEFAEQSGGPARSMYAAPNRRVTHRTAALDVPIPSWMRAPGECPGMFGPEVAMDELAHELGIDPIELRERNEPTTDPQTGLPYSSRNVIACLHRGAEEFGWAARDPRPATRLHGGWWRGTGVAASMYPTARMPTSEVEIAREGGRYVARIGAADLGTGTWTSLAQITADALGVPLDEVDVRIGDTAYPTASVAGGSTGTATWGSAVVAAAREFRAKYGDAPADGDTARAEVPANDAADRYAMSAFGAQFAEVAVHADTGEIRVPRLYGTFAVGRVINPRLARSQLTGGMTMGLGMALHEHGVFDPRTGHVVNHDLAEYHVPAHADVADLRADWIDEHDPYVNPMGAKGVGEIGIVGTAAAVANAVWHATGVRVRDLPITLDALLP
ncbi:xanthine dehydrogenase family protein molybdopterin-binding subunit [Pseudonocardia sp. C8]|uniref:xanthine dehydrogenase family protein molybdopterin-binding subunit n=1 Tax=Pseudonocardia sp. C8 TaxID=2762759 RepID=UPI00164251C8|nr:xanthine dehydrogenase family protein molybdopterin-binding subunit [Pseudonocardia sp. C8]MBC3191369.1 xanthine dehydrogenase family protein molybdopterin-binding subunit [Pseudonocardia sp. C8]